MTDASSASRARRVIESALVAANERLVEHQLRVRPARDEDSSCIIQLVARCFEDYDNCVLDVDAEEPELRTPATSFWRFWAAEDLATGRVVGCVAAAPSLDAQPPKVELKKLYVHPDLRGRRLGRRLIEIVEDVARGVGAKVVDLWSDTRFDTAHRVYERLGYLRGTQQRELHDLSATVEFYYSKRL